MWELVVDGGEQHVSGSVCICVWNIPGDSPTHAPNPNSHVTEESKSLSGLSGGYIVIQIKHSLTCTRTPSHYTDSTPTGFIGLCMRPGISASHKLNSTITEQTVGLKLSIIPIHTN